MPSNDDVRAMLAQLRADAGHGGREPSVLALARRLGLANTTFRRNYPGVVAELAQPTAARQLPESAVSRYEQLRQASTQLRSDNQQLRHDLDLAAAVIARLTLENQQLRQLLEAESKVTRISPAAAQPGSPPERTARGPSHRGST
jgi:hypothetical protein